MKEIVQWVKRTALFLFGVGLIVWGYRANAGNEKPVKPVKPTVDSVKTVVETARQAEEASGSE